MKGIIPVKNSYANYGKEWHYKNKIEIVSGKIYVRDEWQNKIERINEKGEVEEEIEIPAIIDGKDSREMGMWADEDGVGVGDGGRGNIKKGM